MASDLFEDLKKGRRAAKKTTRTAKKVKRKGDEMERKAEKIGDSRAKRRSIINPLFWVGITLYTFGLMISLSIIGTRSACSSCLGGNGGCTKVDDLVRSGLNSDDRMIDSQ